MKKIKRKRFQNHDVLFDLYVNKKLNASECGKILGVSKTTCLNHLKKMGVKIRKEFHRDEFGRYIKPGQKLPPQEGENVWNYKNGRTTYRNKALKHLENQCFHCKKKENLDVHHIDGNRNNNHITNLRVVCRKCHLDVEHKLLQNRDKLGRFKKVK